MREKIETMIQQAIAVDVLGKEQVGGFLSLMGRSPARIQRDIPAVFEAYSLLSHFLCCLPLHSGDLNGDRSRNDLLPAIVYDPSASRLLALLAIGAGELAEVARWLTDSLHSDHIKQMPGILALPFSVERHAGTEILLPEWFAVFYVQGEAGHCIPLLTLPSVLADERFGGDWVAVALERMAEFGLPQRRAREALISQNRLG